jgi:hypothetical protein
VGEFINTVSTEGLQSAMNISGLIGGLITIIALIGSIISFWLLLPAGALLLFAYVFGVISSALFAVYHVGYFHWSQLRDFWTIPGILYLISGILFIISWRIAKKTNHPKLPPSTIS